MNLIARMAHRPAAGVQWVLHGGQRFFELALVAVTRYFTNRVAPIAQLVEHVIRNDGVGGSNPSWGTRQSRKLTTIRGK